MIRRSIRRQIYAITCNDRGTKAEASATKREEYLLTFVSADALSIVRLASCPMPVTPCAGFCYTMTEMKNPPSAPYTVLIVDGSATVRQALRWAMEGLPDLQIIGEASQGEEALRLAQEHSPDIVILEIDLAGRDGYTVARALKSRRPSPLVLFLALHSDAVSQTQCYAAGADGFLPKTSGWTALIALVRRLLEQSNSTKPDSEEHETDKK